MRDNYDSLVSYFANESKRDRQLEAQSRGWEALCDMHEAVIRARELQHRTAQWLQQVDEPWDFTVAKLASTAAALRDLADKLEAIRPSAEPASTPILQAAE